MHCLRPRHQGDAAFEGFSLAASALPHSVHANLAAVAARTVDLFEFVRVFLDRP
jgi:hypothetical protein